jgi:hypothetical protein
MYSSYYDMVPVLFIPGFRPADDTDTTTVMTSTTDDSTDNVVKVL